jgi:prolyl 4-hydroxylase
MHVEALSNEPELLFFHDFVSPEEAKSLIDSASFHPSRVTCREESGCVTDFRTSWSAVIPRTPAAQAVIERGIALTEAIDAEDLQVVRYVEGQEFKPHIDALDDTTEEGRREIARYGGKPRVATFLIYLDGPERGGATVFPHLGLSVSPRKHAAVFWRNLTAEGKPDWRLLHGGAPVERGVKYAANLWLRGDGRVWRNGRPLPNALQ